MGLVGAAFGLGFVVGPAIGGLSSGLGNAAPGLVAAGLSALNLVLAAWWLPESRVESRESRQNAPPPVHWSRFLMPFAAVGFSTVAFTVLYVVFPLQLERVLGYDRHHSAYFFVLIGIVSAVIQGGLIGRLVQRFGERTLIASGGVLLAGGLALLPVVLVPGPRSGLLWGALVLIATGAAMIAPSAASFVSRVASPDEQGRALGLLQSVGSVARIAGPVSAGVVATHLHAAAAFLVASGVALVAGLSSVIGTVD
jgi:MFS family permease